MQPINRRQFIGDITCLTIASLAFPWPLGAQSHCRVAHPLSPPDRALTGRCPNCGMMRAMWARTWKTFRLDGDRLEACSFHCLADQTLKSGQMLGDVQTALFLQPRGMVSAREAWYVVGSEAKGTMTMVSKAAFPSRSRAINFARSCGGEVLNYEATFQMARETVAKENGMIDSKRLAKGKIVPPVDTKDECIMCRMYPSRYPRHRSQVSYGKGRIDHFCSTHCLFAWLNTPDSGRLHQGGNGMIWVTDFVSERWISGKTAYYVVGSTAQGPMGTEAFAFDKKNQAQEFVRKNGGRVLSFKAVATGPYAWPV